MKIQICCGKTCSERYSEYILKRVEGDKKMFELENLVVETCLCTGNCQKGPNVIIDGKIEHHCNPIKVSKMILASKKQNKKKEKIQPHLEEPTHTGEFKLVPKNDDAPEENIYLKDHIHIIKNTDDTSDI